MFIDQCREAFELTPDRDQINRIVFNGKQLPGCNPIAPVNAFYPKDLKCPARDVAKAKKLIAEIIEKIRARRTSLYLYHQNLFAAYSARVVGLEMYADGMPRLKSAGFAAAP